MGHINQEKDCKEESHYHVEGRVRSWSYILNLQVELIGGDIEITQKPFEGNIWRVVELS